MSFISNQQKRKTPHHLGGGLYAEFSCWDRVRLFGRDKLTQSDVNVLYLNLEAVEKLLSYLQFWRGALKRKVKVTL